MRTLWLAAAAALPACGDGPCGEEEACEVDAGRYYAVAPAGWDGETKLPVLVLAHGYQGSPEGFLRSPGVTGPASDFGVLLVLPEGMDATWSVSNTGLIENGRDEVAFIGAVLDDVETRWPVDTSRVYMSGFSLGASLTYDIACQMGDRFAAAAPTAGGLWDPMPATCPSAPLPLCHIHGNNDITWPIEGGRRL